MDQQAHGEPLEIEISAVVIRGPNSEYGPPGPQDLGKVAYWHKNPLKRLAWRLRNRRT